jgi:N,N'-diacetyllegionaminate synthase
MVIMKFNKEIHIEGKLISATSPTFVIAEAGVNHGGNMEIAKQLIDLAVKAKADAVKFQTFKTEHLILSDIQKAPYQKNTTDASESQFDMLKKLEVTREQNLELKRHCIDKDIIFLTTPFDEESLDEIDELDLPAYKVASTDATNLPFLKKIAKKGKPIFLSTGMSYLSEVRLALEAIYEHNKDVVLLQCTANYPIQDNEVNLAVINTYRDNFDILLGYSDHSVGVGAAPFAIPMGAKVVEKHFTINKYDEGPDHATSLSPDELIDFVKTVRRVDEYMGSTIKEPTPSEMGTRRSLQKCMVANKEIKKGELFSNDNLAAKRTGGIGISPIDFEKIIGVKSHKTYKKNEVISID